jgi:hypothetical protein
MTGPSKSYISSMAPKLGFVAACLALAFASASALEPLKGTAAQGYKTQFEVVKQGDSAQIVSQVMGRDGTRNDFSPSSQHSATQLTVCFKHATGRQGDRARDGNRKGDWQEILEHQGE